MINDDSLRDIFHYLTNKLGIISLNSQSFVLLYGDDSTDINNSTKCELLRVIGEIEAYHKEAIDRLDLTSKTISKTIASKDWINVKDLIEQGLKDVSSHIAVVKEMSQKIPAANFKTNILNIAKEMDWFLGKCDSMNELVEDFKNKLLSLGIYDYVYDDKGKVIIKILSCSPDEDGNASVKNYFEKKGFIVYTAKEGEEALQIIREKRPQIACLSDKLHDSISSLDVLEEIRQVGYATKVIMITAYLFDEIKEKLRRKNLYANEYIMKPLKISELEKKVRELIAG